MSADNKYNVLMVAACPFPANHGSAASIREMSEALVKLGHTVHVVTYPIQEDIPVADGVCVHRVSMPFMRPGKVKVGPAREKFFYDPLMILKTIGLIRKYKIDVIHAHNYEGAMIGWCGKILTRRPMLYNAVNSMADELPTYNFIKPRRLAVWLGRMLDSLVPHTGDLVTVVSDALKDFLILKGVPKQIIRVVPAGVNLDMFARGDGVRVRTKHELDKAPLVLYAGAFEEFQRIDYLLKAMTRVIQFRPDAHLMLAGSVANQVARERYQVMAEELGISKSVTIVDAVSLPELPDYLAAADVTVVPRPECPGHPVKLLNYMAAGKATVSFKGGAKGLHHMYNGYLVDDHDYEGLGDGIIFLLGNENIRKAIAARARDTIAGNFDWETLAKGIALLYKMMLEGGADGEMESALARCFRDSYVLKFVERRNLYNIAKGTLNYRSKRDRRQESLHTRFLEQRKVAFAGSEPISLGNLSAVETGSRECSANFSQDKRMAEITTQ